MRSQMESQTESPRPRYTHYRCYTCEESVALRDADELLCGRCGERRAVCRRCFIRSMYTDLGVCSTCMGDQKSLL